MQNHDLFDFLASITQEIENEYKRIQKRSKDDPGTAGDQGEENWATLLRNWLPPTFQIVTKGRILSHTGNASPQVDVLVLQPEYPKHFLDKKLYLAAGVVAAFECKLTLRPENIIKTFENSKNIRALLDVRSGSPYKELQSPILYGLLAHSHNWKSLSNSEAVKKVTELIYKNDSEFINHPREMLDIMCIADLATWSCLKENFMGSDLIGRAGPNVWEVMKDFFGPNGSASTSYICHFKEKENQIKSFTPIGTMISRLFNKLAWENPRLRPLAAYFQSVNISGSGAGGIRKWDESIYSEKIRSQVVAGDLHPGTFNWNEWSVAFV